MEAKEHHLIFLPGPGTSHITPAIKVGKLILSRASSISITYLIISDHRDTKDRIKSLQSNHDPRLRFHNLPEAENQNVSSSESSHKLKAKRDVNHIKNHKPQVRQAIHEIFLQNTKTKVVGLVVDMFCSSMIDMGNEFGIPSYVFYSSSASFLSFKLFFQSLRDEHNKDITQYRDSDEEFSIPGFVNPVPAKVMPTMMLDANGGSELVMESARQMRQAKGIFINTFEEIDRNAIKAFAESNGKIPTIYPVGPLINLDSQLEPSDYAIINWLDQQSPSSVVFLCFGSHGSFVEPQIKNLAEAIESCGYRFLWTLRIPKESTFDEVLPEGFLNRTSGIGKVIGWAPQTAVLSHPAIGGFVSHCGWNSILESVWFGVPIAAWPIEAEQQVNAFHIVKELGIAVEIKIDYRGDVEEQRRILVEPEVIKSAINRIMGEKESSKIRKKIKVLREEAVRASMAGSSSDKFLQKLIQYIIEQP